MKKKYYPELKMKVFSESHSCTIQQALFNLGYRWIHPLNKLKNTQAPYLFTDRLGCISHSKSDVVFATSSKIEVGVDNLFTGKAQNKENISGAVIVLDNKKYKIVSS